VSGSSPATAGGHDLRVLITPAPGRRPERMGDLARHIAKVAGCATRRSRVPTEIPRRDLKEGAVALSLVERSAT